MADLRIGPRGNKSMSIGHSGRIPVHADWKSIGALRHMDYAIEGGRVYRLSIIEEILEKFECDGIQLDFGRTAPFVSEPKREKGPLMTEYIQNVRALLDKFSQGENRKTLGVVLPWDIDFCHEEGLEVQRWVNEGLIDFIIPGEWYYADWNLPQQAWIEMNKSTGCKFYPFTPGNVSSYQDFEQGEPSLLGENRSLDGPKIRAIADNFSAQGSDGFAFYNFYTFDFGQHYPELRKWLDSKESADLSRHYLNCRRLVYHATERDSYDLGLAFERYPLNEANDEVSIPFRFSSNLSGKKTVLRCAFIGSEAGDEIEIKLNDTPLKMVPQATSPTATIHAAELNASTLLTGENTLLLKLAKVSSTRTSTIKAGEFEILVENNS